MNQHKLTPQRINGRIIAGLLTAGLLAGGCTLGPQVVRYNCTADYPIRVVYPDEQTALVHLSSRVYTMHVAATPLGKRYVGDGFQWITRNGTRGKPVGTLFLSDGQGQPGQIVERCRPVN